MDNNVSAIGEYQKLSEHYLSNANETIQKKELQKASELLWGAVTQRVKKLAALSNKRIYGHKDYKPFLASVGKEINDGKIYNLFCDVEKLHYNFYDKIIDEEEFPIYYKRALELIGLIDSIISDLTN